MMTDSRPVAEAFEYFVRSDGERLRRVMAAQYGVEIGADAANAALAWAWEHWDRLAAMSNPGGYLYRVAQTEAKRDISRGRIVRFPDEHSEHHDQPRAFDAGLASALVQLSESQRLAVVMVHAYGWTPTELSDVTGTSAATIRSHLRRGLRRLRFVLLESDRS